MLQTGYRQVVMYDVMVGYVCYGDALVAGLIDRKYYRVSETCEYIAPAKGGQGFRVSEIFAKLEQPPRIQRKRSTTCD